MKKTAAGLVASFLLFGILTACSSGSQAASQPNVLDDTHWQEAADLYKQHCISCHAADMSGMVGPNLQHIGSSLDRTKISAVIGNGKGGMPAFHKILKQDEIEKLAEWLASLK
ncbi:c-type cytochrome [Ferviditalea candida]|uniref:Cytochrome c n=1 Tax=Ferviditalea candida TaxID=3108399 RepID=A0ABU5ZNB0_9BACL|nr:cytochrome c [Paenibacillaceae bacterium T2]